MTGSDDQAWVPAACTLPTAERPLRLAEFGELFATALRGQHRRSATELCWELDPAAGDAARDLAGRESRCCSFFGFTFRSGAGRLWLDVEVPTAYVEILDALEQRAQAGMRSSGPPPPVSSVE